MTGCGLPLENGSDWKGGFEVSVRSVTVAGLVQEAVEKRWRRTPVLLWRGCSASEKREMGQRDCR